MTGYRRRNRRSRITPCSLLGSHSSWSSAPLLGCAHERWGASLSATLPWPPPERSLRFGFVAMFLARSPPRSACSTGKASGSSPACARCYSSSAGQRCRRLHGRVALPQAYSTRWRCVEVWRIVGALQPRGSSAGAPLRNASIHCRPLCPCLCLFPWWLAAATIAFWSQPLVRSGPSAAILTDSSEQVATGMLLGLWRCPCLWLRRRLVVPTTH
mmetsp:Transcript_78802/g.168860  ORF Transcript_78802/g.168860 Transcript_78802/m.168860 type:complete len:214 (-) Transcript_78802:671-1312(-)